MKAVTTVRYRKCARGADTFQNVVTYTISSKKKTFKNRRLWKLLRQSTRTLSNTMIVVTLSLRVTTSKKNFINMPSSINYIIGNW